MKKGKTKEEIAKTLTEQLVQEHEHWQDLYENGGSDPFWPDGVNLNLVRNHIIYCRKQIEEQLEETEYPDAYYWKVPKEVASNYMANVDSIRKNAVAALKRYREDGNYQYLKGMINSPGLPKEIHSRVVNAIALVDRLEDEIQNDRLVEMRRDGITGYRLEMLAKTRKYVENAVEKRRQMPVGQLSLFDLGII